VSKNDDLKKIVEDIEKNDITPKLREGATKLVFGDGNENAEVVFIGEAPGKNEDVQGKPFVGAAGKFLNEMLETIGLRREDIYITNIVKYRPPNNRDPLPEEKKAFWPYLVRQLDVIKPKLVVTLGRHSMEYFLPDQKISAIHGEPKRIHFKSNTPNNEAGSEMTTGLDVQQGRREQQTDLYKQVLGGRSAPSDAVERQEKPQHGELSSSTGGLVQLVILPLFHPAAALYNGGLRQTLIADFSRIPTILEKI
jgi:uracil-DNA glycosylase